MTAALPQALNVRAFGSIAFDGRSWIVSAAPQVRARLKRVFPRAPQHAANTLPLLASAENSRELLWFTQRYPMTMDLATRDRMERLAAEHVRTEQDLADLLAGRREVPAFSLAKPERQYQAYAAAQMMIKGGLLVADDLGLGKTVTAMCAMALAGNLPTVVVYPASLPNHWPEKLAEFCPGLRVHHVNKGSPYPLIKQPRQRRTDLWDTLPDVILISYHKLRGWAEVLAELVQYVVFEECQQLRSSGTEIYTAAKHLRAHARYCMGLSATPIYNYGGEFWNVIDVILPDCLGDRDEFLREWCVRDYGDDKPRLADAEMFGEYLRREGIMLRRTREEVGRELPELTKITHEIEHDEGVLRRVKTDAVELAKTILDANERFRGEHMQAAGEFDRLMRQATGVAKAPFVAEFTRMLLEQGEQVLVFAWHREVYSILQEALAIYSPVLYTGSESPNQKQAAKDAFVAGQARVMLISVRAGAGVDGLQHVCATTVHAELDWSPGVIEQNIGRVHRDGQQRPVQAFFPLSSDGTDPIMCEVLGVKREQIEGVRNPGQHLVERADLGENQLKHLARRYLVAQGEALPEVAASEPARSVQPRPEKAVPAPVQPTVAQFDLL